MNIYIKPKDDRQVPDPETGKDLPAEGREVEKNQYWMKRLKDGDVIIEQSRKGKSYGR